MKRDALPSVDPLTHSPEATAAAALWPAALLALGAALAWIVACFFNTAAAMVGIWARSETFAHGFVVAPISLWLIWRMRARLRAMTPTPSWIVLPLLGAAGFVWLLGEVGAVNAVAQLAFVAMLVLTVPAVLGIRIARAMLFPLAFLFFAVPIGEFLLPTLMLHTADFTVLGLRASGVPVYREGLQLVIPTGRWSIVEACSGIRYLIASIVVGTLFAYLNYTAYWRRLAFVAFAIAVPIVANWLRAYMIVMIGHLSDNRLATGVDHIIYGWVFFGLVMLVMFAVGARWREPVRTPVAADTIPIVDSPSGGPRRIWGAAVAVLAVTLAWPLLEQATRPGDTTSTLGAIDVAGWNPTPADPSRFTPHFTGGSAVRHEQWQNGDRKVGLFVAYYRGQTTERKLVSSDNVLVRSTDPHWHVIATGERRSAMPGHAVDVAVARLRGTDGEILAARQWYWINGTITASDAFAKALIAWNRMTGRGDDAAVIIVYTPAVDEDNADRTLETFIGQAWPAIETALVRARDSAP
jgi:exosortase A